VTTADVLAEAIEFVDLGKLASLGGDLGRRRDGIKDQIERVWWSQKSFFIRDPDGELDPKKIQGLMREVVGRRKYVPKMAELKAIGRYTDKRFSVSISKGKGKDGSVAYKVTARETLKQATDWVRDSRDKARAFMKGKGGGNWVHTAGWSDDQIVDAYKVRDTLPRDVAAEVVKRMRK
jgi:hypothetical protein